MNTMKDQPNKKFYIYSDGSHTHTIYKYIMIYTHIVNSTNLSSYIHSYFVPVGSIVVDFLEVATFGRLLEAGAKKDPRHSSGATPLHYAAQNGCSEAATLLLDVGAEGDAARTDGATPLHVASLHGRLEPQLQRALQRAFAKSICFACSNINQFFIVLHSSSCFNFPNSSKF